LCSDSHGVMISVIWNIKLMSSPILILQRWIKEETVKGNPFPQGAVLSSISKDNVVHSRVVGTMIDKHDTIRFHTSPNSRKVSDIKFARTVSLSYSFQYSLRSFNIEGEVSPLNKVELESDWMKFEMKFRKEYLVFGDTSGNVIDDRQELERKRANLKPGEEDFCPRSFIGYKFTEINRVSVYSVSENDFAISTLYERDTRNGNWLERKVVP